MSYRSIVSATLWSILLTGGISASASGFTAETIAPPSPQPAGAMENSGLGSGTISAIRVEGNQRIESGTITSYLGLKPGDTFNQSDIDNGLKNLFATGFFADVKLLRQGNSLLVRVVENPVISKVAFEGNDRVETKDLEKEIELKARSIYSQDKVQSDVKRLLDIYRRGGRYNATVEPKIIKQDQNRVDLIYEITEGPIAYVQRISFIGNEHFDTATLRKTLRTEETRWYKFLSDNDKYDPDRLQFDQELLRRFYNNEGYADFQVKSANAQLSPNKDSFYITFVVDEGPQYKLGTVKVINDLSSKDAKDGKPSKEKIDLDALITMKPGKYYDASKVEDSIDAMTKALGDHGYAFVDIQPKLDRETDAHIINLTFNVKPGPRVYVERINITGNVRTLDQVVRREFRLSEGDAYNTAKMQRSEQRLNNLGFFEKVNVKNEPGSAPDKTVVNVEVKEKSTGEINVGAGYSTTDGILGDFGVKESNLMGTGDELKTNFVLASRRKQAELGFTDPYCNNHEIACGFDIYRNYEDLTRESSYVSDVKGINLRATYSLQEKLQHTVYYTIHQNTISDVPSTASLYILDQTGTDVTSAVGQTLAYDQRDNRLSPTRGYFASITEEVAGLGGEERYLKHEAKASYYYPVAPKWILSALGSGGYIFGLDGQSDLHITDRFFVGGDNLRGFRDAGIGPRDTTTLDALGGNAYYTATAELKFPLGLPEELGVSGAVFTDAGSLFHSDAHGPTVFNSDAVRLSSGVGVLWSSPFGPIRIDYAHAFLKQQEDRTEDIRFSFGTRF